MQKDNIITVLVSVIASVVVSVALLFGMRF